MTKGNQGYIDREKKKHLILGLSGMASMFAIYLLGLMVTGSNASFGTLLAVLIALPSAQMLARYFSLYSYHSTDRHLVQSVKASGAVASYELVLVYGKKSFYMEAASIGTNGVILLSEDHALSGRDIEEMLKAKGIRTRVTIYRDRDTFISHLTANTDQDGILDRFMENAL